MYFFELINNFDLKFKIFLKNNKNRKIEKFGKNDCFFNFFKLFDFFTLFIFQRMDNNSKSFDYSTTFPFNYPNNTKSVIIFNFAFIKLASIYQFIISFVNFKIKFNFIT